MIIGIILKKSIYFLTEPFFHFVLNFQLAMTLVAW